MLHAGAACTFVFELQLGGGVYGFLLKNAFGAWRLL